LIYKTILLRAFGAAGLALGPPILVCMIGFTPMGAFGGIMFLLFYLASGVILLGVGLYYLARLRLKQATSLLIIPFVIGLMIAYPIGIKKIIYLADSLNFCLHSFELEAKIGEKTAGSDAPRFLIFFWRDISGVSGFDWEYLVFDESDELGLPPDKRSPEWKARAVKSNLFVPLLEGNFDINRFNDVTPFFGHWYFVFLQNG
jgi:hypothetical protein